MHGVFGFPIIVGSEYHSYVVFAMEAIMKSFLVATSQLSQAEADELLGYAQSGEIPFGFLACVAWGQKPVD